MSSVSDRISFDKICMILEAIQKYDGKRRRHCFDKLLKDWRSNCTELHGSLKPKSTKDSFVCALRLILPDLDRDREAYGIKENTLAKKIVKTHGMTGTSQDAKSLTSYVKPAEGTASKGVKDFADLASEVLATRCEGRKSSYTVAQVNDALDNLAEGHTRGDRELVDRTLLALLRSLTLLEQKWLFRIILKSMKLSARDSTIFGFVHPDAHRLFDATTSLRKVCEQLYDPSRRLKTIGISVFDPFRPMLGLAASPFKIGQLLLETKSFIAETKYDGERMQLHMSGGTYKYFSRHGLDWTSTFGDVPQRGTLTPFISRCWKPAVESCVLDGEMLGYDHDKKNVGTKVDGFDVKNPRVETYTPYYMAFDVTFYNGESLIDRPLADRKKILSSLFDDIEGKIVVSKISF